MAYLESTSGANFSVAQSVTSSAASTNMFDTTGAGAGNSPAMIGAGGINTALGFDIGTGSGVEQPVVLVSFGTCTTVSGTLTIAIQVAADNGSYSAGTFHTIESSAALTGTSQLFSGAQFFMKVPPVPQGILSGSLPRFYQLYYTVGSSISVVVNASLLLDPPAIAQATQYGNNFVAGL